MAVVVGFVVVAEIVVFDAVPAVYDSEIVTVPAAVPDAAVPDAAALPYPLSGGRTYPSGQTLASGGRK